jgi:DNA/RNA-binding domain of Phe-tRNA-synthetase-like protein
MLTLEPYPDFHSAVFITSWPAPLGDLPSAGWMADLLRLDALAPIQRSELVRGAVRDLLRHRGYKPTGRGKPASEYLVKAAEESLLQPINLAVDTCNTVSLHSGLPISVIDFDLATPPLRIAPGVAGQSYVFNLSGQEIDVEGLLCLHDEAGPCANPVKDAQRTKTNADTRRTLTVIWGAKSIAQQTEDALAWYRALLIRLEARVDVLVG